MALKFLDDSGILPEVWEFEANGDLRGVSVSMDVESVMHDVALKAGATGGKGSFGWHVGTLPMPVVMEYAKLRGIDASSLLYDPAYADELVKLATHRDYRAFSPTEGKA